MLIIPTNRLLKNVLCNWALSLGNILVEWLSEILFIWRKARRRLQISLTLTHATAIQLCRWHRRTFWVFLQQITQLSRCLFWIHDQGLSVSLFFDLFYLQYLRSDFRLDHGCGLTSYTGFDQILVHGLSGELTMLWDQTQVIDIEINLRWQSIAGNSWESVIMYADDTYWLNVYQHAAEKILYLVNVREVVRWQIQNL